MPTHDHLGHEGGTVLPMQPRTGRLLENADAQGVFITQALAFQQLVMLYESANKCVLTQLDIFGEECRAGGKHVPIASVQSRVKEPMSIARKLQKLGYPPHMENIRAHLNDVAGVRVICPYLTDIYAVRRLLLSLENVTLIKEKDYIKNPKANGYRSLHLIVEVDVALSEATERVRCEIQLRTISMDSWASLEHQLRYKSRQTVDESTAQELTRCAQMLFATDLKMEEIAQRMGTFEHIDTDASALRLFR